MELERVEIIDLQRMTYNLPDDFNIHLSDTCLFELRGFSSPLYWHMYPTWFFSSLSSFCLVATKSANTVPFIELMDGYILKPSPTTIINFSYKELALTFSELHPWASDCTQLATHIMVMSLTEPQHSAAIALSLIDVLNFSWIKPESIPAICCRLRAKQC